MSAAQFVLYINVTLTTVLFIASVWYFLRVKSIWRWIKLAYAIALATLLFVYGLVLFGSTPISLVVQRLTITILLVTMGSGLIVSYCKMSLARSMDYHDRRYDENSTTGIEE